MAISPEGLPDPGGQPVAQPRPGRELAAGVRARVQRDDVPSLAAAAAFKLFLSLFPAAAAAIAAFSLVIDPVTFVDRLSGVVPPEALNLVEGQLENLRTRAGGVLGVGALAGLWAATSAAATLVKGLNRVFEVTESRSFVGQRLVALLLTLALLLALSALVVLVVLGPQLRRWLLPEGLAGGVGAVLVGAAQVVGALLVLMLLFAFTYWVGPNRRAPWRWLSPGAVIGVIGWLVLSGAFTLFTQTAANYEATYSGLAGVVVLLLWLQLSMGVLLVGAVIDAERERRAEREEVLQAAAGVGLADPVSDPLAFTPARPGLPAAVHGRSGVRRAAVAASGAVAAAITALVAATRSRE